MRKIVSLFFIAITIASCQKSESSISTPQTLKPYSVDDAKNLSFIKIGTQKWMASNLNVTTYRNGDKIPQVKDPSKWMQLTTGAWCYYNENSANGKIYGKLYNWYAVNDPRGLAPAGWHVPTIDEWYTLANFISNYNTAIAGGKLKEAGTSHWLSPNTGADNSSNFTALPGGYFPGSIFYDLGTTGYWWASNIYSDSYSQYVGLNYKRADFVSAYTNKWDGFSIRCVKD